MCCASELAQNEGEKKSNKIESLGLASLPYNAGTHLCPDRSHPGEYAQA